MENIEQIKNELVEVSSKINALLTGRRSDIGLTCLTSATLQLLKITGMDIENYCINLKKCKAEHDKIEDENEPQK